MSEIKKIDYERSPEKRYPTYKIESGQNFRGILSTLNKPHGLQDLMTQIIREVSKGDKRYTPLAGRLARSYSSSDIAKAIDILVIDGILQTKSKNKKPNKSDLEWELQIISLDPRAQATFSRTEEPLTEKYDQLKTQIDQLVAETKSSALKTHLLQCCNEKVLTSPKGDVVCGTNAWVKFRSITLTLAYAIVLLDQEKREPLRVLSERIWGKSKILDRYKKDIARVAGQSLNRLNLTSMPEVTFVHGDVTYRYQGYLSSLMAGSPYVLTEGTIKGLEIEQVSAEKMLIVENYAVFQEVFVRKYQDRPDVLLLWGAGYLSSPKKRLVDKILQVKAIPVYIWSDLDADGLGLTLDIIKKVRKYDIEAQPILMSASELDLAKGDYVASNHHNLDDLELAAVFPDVIERIRLQNVMEQEELLLHYERVEDRLP